MAIIKTMKTTGSFGTVGFLLTSAIFNVTGQKKVWYNYAAKSILLCICFAVQVLFSALDMMSRYKGSTANNMIIARKI